MKTPLPPPDFNRLLARVTDDGRLPQVLLVDHRSIEVAATPYIPWDKLRHLEPPSGLSHEEWWLAVRFSRRANRRYVAELVDRAGTPFSYSLPDEVLREIDRITRDASGSIGISEQVTNPSTRDRYIVNSLIEEAIQSSQLEGASTSRKVAKAMIRSGRKPADRSEQMILNNYLAMRQIIEWREEEITPERICRLHEIVTRNTLEDPAFAGQVQQRDDERVAVWDEDGHLLHTPPPVAELPDRLAAICSFANTKERDNGPYLHPVLRAIAVHFMFGYDHYFEDGNGRTARIAFYWVMLRNDFWLAEFLTISKILKNAPSQYVRSYLLTEQDEGDLTYFFVYHLQVIHRAIRELHAYLGRKAEELHDLQRAVSAVPGDFNHRQLAVLELAIKDSQAFFSAQSHAQSHRVTNETARNDLLDLQRRGFLTRFKNGRSFAWSPAANLRDLIGG